MATGSSGRIRRLVFKCGVIVGLFFCVALPVLWLSAPSLIENWFIESMEEGGYEASLDVRLGVNRSAVSDFTLKGEGLSLQVSEIWTDYDFDSLSKTRVNTVVASGAQVEVDLDLLLATEDEPEKTLTLEQQLNDWASLTFLTHTRLEKTRLGVTSGGIRSEHSLTGWLDTSVRPHLSLECNSSLGNLGLGVNRYGLGVGLTAFFRMPEILEPVRVAKLYLEDDWPDGLDVVGGELEVQAGVRVKGDDLLKKVVQATGENLAIILPPQEVNGTRWPASSQRFSVVATEGYPGFWKAKLGGSFMVGNFLQLDDLVAGINLGGDKVVLDLQNADGQLILPDDQVRFAGLGGAANLVRGEPWTLAGESTFSFDELGYGGDEIVLYNGMFKLAFQGEGDPVKVSLPPCYALLPAAQVSLDGLRFDGELLSLSDPAMTAPQELRISSVMLAEEPALKDFALTFRIDDNGTILIDSLGFESSGVRMEIRPGRGEVALNDDGGATVELADTTIQLPNEEVTITGVSGVVRCDSIDPLKILEQQELVFAKATYGDLHWGPGKIGFTLDENGTFALSRCEGDFLGGTLRIEPTRFDLFADEITLSFTLALEEVIGERLGEIMPGFEGELKGLLSGRIPLSDRDGDWNYQDGGHLELAPVPEGRLSYPADGLLTEGMDPKSSNYKRSRLVELALQDLQVKKLRFELLEDLLEGRVIKGEVLGSSMVDKKLINVTYRPKLKGDLVALLRQLQFGGLSFE